MYYFPFPMMWFHYATTTWKLFEARLCPKHAVVLSRIDIHVIILIKGKQWSDSKTNLYRLWKRWNIPFSCGQMTSVSFVICITVMDHSVFTGRTCSLEGITLGNNLQGANIPKRPHNKNFWQPLNLLRICHTQLRWPAAQSQFLQVFIIRPMFLSI